MHGADVTARDTSLARRSGRTHSDASDIRDQGPGDGAGFDRAVERGGIQRALASSQYDASDIVAELVLFVIFLPFLSAAVGTLGIDALEQPLAAFMALIPRILVAVVLVVIGAVVAGTVKAVIRSTLGGLSYGGVLADVASVLVLLGFGKAALDQVGIATTVTGPLLYTVLGTVAGVVVIGAGGGLIKPMQSRWETLLTRAETESADVQAQARTSGSAPQAGAYPDEPAYRSAPTGRTVAPGADAPTAAYSTGARR